MKSSGLTRNQDSMLNELDYVELGLFCADICRALERGMNGKKLGDVSQSVCDAINQLTTQVDPTIYNFPTSYLPFSWS